MRELFAATLVILSALGCRESLAPGESAAISVTVNVAGVYPLDGFQVKVDDRAMTLQKSAPNVVVRGLSPGPHTVALVGLAQNCRSDGANPVTVQASSADISPVEFSVNCLANSGAIAVAISVSDYSRPLFFPTQVDSSGVRGIAKGNSTTVLPGIFAGGLHKVTLTGIPTFCEPTGELSTSVEIKTGTAMQDTAIASFHMSCNPPDLQSDTAAAIVFERDGYVMLVRETGGSATAVTQGSKPVWAPDGNSIAFQRTKCDADQICERDLWLRAQAGNEEKPINTDPYFDDYDVAFSPTGDRISFVRIWLGPDQSYLMLSDLHGQSLKILSIWNPEGTPSWSPDGAQIVFSCQTGASFTMQLCLANPAGGCESYFPANCKLPLNVLTADPADHLEPAWSPDGSRVAFTVACGGYPPACPAGITASEPYVAVIDLSTHQTKRLVPGHDAAWSPDGQALLFAGNASAPGLHIYKLADGSIRQLTDNPHDTSPSWRE